MSWQAEPLLDVTRVTAVDWTLLCTGRLIDAARAFCVAWDVYDQKSTPQNLKTMTLARQKMRAAYREEQEIST